MIKSILFVIALIGLSTADANMAVNFSAGKGNVNFLAVGKPSALKIKGEGSAPQGTLTVAGNKLSGTLELDLSSLKTGISMRDNHMKDKYLEVGKFPKAILTLKDVTLPDPLVAKNDIELKDLPFKGKLKLKDVEKDVMGSFSVKRSASNATLDAKFDIKLSSFNVGIPSYAGITVADDVKVDVHSDLAVSKK